MIQMKYIFVALLATGLICVGCVFINDNKAFVKMEAADYASINSLNFSPDGLLLASSATKVADGEARPIGGGIQIWNPKTGSLIRTLTKFRNDTNVESIGPILFSPDGRMFIGINSGLTAWDTSTWKIEHSMKSGAWAAISPYDRVKFRRPSNITLR